MRTLVLVLALAVQALAQSTLVTVDTYGTLTTPSVVTLPGVASGTYTSGITASGTQIGQTCLITFTNGGGFGATALVPLTSLTNPTIAAGTKLQITANGQGYTSAPTMGNVAPGGSNPATSCTGTATVSTILGGYVVDGLIGSTPVTPASGHERLWFDNSTSVTAPWAIDSSGNFNSMVRIAKGTLAGNFLPIYTGVGGAYTPTTTFQVYNPTPSAIAPATFVSGTGTLVVTSSGTSTYTGSTPLTYCIQINTPPGTPNG